MIRNFAAFRAFDEAEKARWLSALTVEEAFRIADELDCFSRMMAPEAFAPAPGDPSLRDDPHIRAIERMRAAFARVRSPAA